MAAHKSAWCPPPTASLRGTRTRGEFATVNHRVLQEIRLHPGHTLGNAGKCGNASTQQAGKIGGVELLRKGGCHGLRPSAIVIQGRAEEMVSDGVHFPLMSERDLDLGSDRQIANYPTGTWELRGTELFMIWICKDCD